MRRRRSVLPAADTSAQKTLIVPGQSGTSSWRNSREAPALTVSPSISAVFLWVMVTSCDGSESSFAGPTPICATHFEESFMSRPVPLANLSRSLYQAVALYDSMWPKLWKLGVIEP